MVTAHIPAFSSKFVRYVMLGCNMILMVHIVSQCSKVSEDLIAVLYRRLHHGGLLVTTLALELSSYDRQTAVLISSANQSLR